MLSHLHELVHNAFDYPFTIILVRFLPFHAIEHLHTKAPKLQENKYFNITIYNLIMTPSKIL